MSEEFPVAEMTQGHNERASRAQFAVHRLRIFQRDALRNFGQRHRPELDAAKQVRAEPLEMPASEAAQFRGRFFLAESDREIVLRQPPITAENEPREQAERFAKGKKEAQRQRTNES